MEQGPAQRKRKAAPVEVLHLHGATVVVDPGHAEPGAAIHLAGPAEDDSGALHVLEHMVFRDGAAGPGGDLYSALMSSHPLRDLNASTLSTHTSFHFTAATPDGRDAILPILLRAVLHPGLEPAHLAEERAIVASEMAGFWADRQAAALEGLRAMVCPGQRAAQAGLPDLVRKLGVADLRAEHQRHYRADGMLLHVTGARPGPVLWQGLAEILRTGTAPFLPPAEATPPQALPMAVPPGRGLPGLAWHIPGLGPRAAEVLRSAVEALVPGARSRCGIGAGMADLRLVGPELPMGEAETWLQKAVRFCEGPDFAASLRARARQALLQPCALPDRRAALVQAWQQGADLAAALMADETPRLMDWANAGRTGMRALADILRQPAVAHVFQGGDLLPQVRVLPPPAPLPSPGRRRGVQAPEVSVLPLTDLRQADLPTAGALLRGLAARDGLRIQLLTPGPWAAFTVMAGQGDPLAGDAPPLAPPVQQPLHLTIERRLWAALTPEGAALAGMEGAADPAAADRIWSVLKRRGLSPDLTTQPEAPRETLPLPQQDQTLPGALSTLGLGLALPQEPLLPLFAHALEWHWLRQMVRRAGGAYGVRCRVGPGGALVFLAARDPAPPEATLSIFAQSGEWLRRHLRGDMLAGAIQGTMGKLAAPPAPEWGARLTEWQSRLDPWQAPDRLRAAVAGASAAQVADAADRLDAAMAGAVRLVYRGLAQPG